ncbi:hypothetical protein [Mycobacterium aquaticum]|uniref:hypothetical protein n=1 Tax=Mycobacterium aquaticum TaxID=1927124 RepID=UPI001FE5609E|nr:hypothetical protein [Mycobacterium aquaticum]
MDRPVLIDTLKAFPALSRTPRRDELAMHIKAGGVAFEGQTPGRQVAWIRRANDGAWMAVCLAPVYSGNRRSHTTMQLWLEPDAISPVNKQPQSPR